MRQLIVRKNFACLTSGISFFLQNLSDNLLVLYKIKSAKIENQMRDNIL